MPSFGQVCVYKTSRGVEILVERGKKQESQYAFIIRYRDPATRAGRIRTPKHIHPIVEMYVKQAYNPNLTLQLRDHILLVFDQVQAVTQFPPHLQVFKPSDTIPFAPLDAVGEFSVEFLLVVTELLFIQEKTNYPQGSLTRNLYVAFGVRDRFQVVQAATQGRIIR
jgi:hypothetical protein